MPLESVVRALLRSLSERVRHWRRLRALDGRISSLEDDVEDLERLLAGARRRLEREASDAAFRAHLERDIGSVRGIGPTLAERIVAHPLTGTSDAFRASVDKVDGVGPKKKELLLAWERRTREERRTLRKALLEEGGVDPELEATIVRLEGDLADILSALDSARRRRRRLARGGPGTAGPARVVLDTNVFVGAGFHPGSASAALVRAVEGGRPRMPWTEATRSEVERILRKIPPLSWASVRPLFRDEDRVDGPLDEAGLDWIPDPDDRPFAALARSAGAVLVSSDDDLLGARDRAGFPVLRPGEGGERLLS